MAIEIKKRGDEYSIKASPPHSVREVHSDFVSIKELINISNENDIHTQDFWDAVVECDPGYGKIIN